MEQKAEKKKQAGFVPNSFQTPNGYVDDVMPYLTGEEYKVLSYATRRILGFQKRQDRISVSQFTDGTKNKDGEILDRGTGLSIGTVKSCLANLVAFGLMVREAENDPKTNEGTLWSLQWNDDEVKWQALYERAEKWKIANNAKIQKARSVRQTGVCGTELPPTNGTEVGGAGGTEIQKTDLEIQGYTENVYREKKDSILKIISTLAPSVFGADTTKWWEVRRRLESDEISIVGNPDQKPDPSNPMQIVIGGLNMKPKGGQFTEAEIWEERFYPSFARLGLEIKFLAEPAYFIAQAEEVPA